MNEEPLSNWVAHFAECGYRPGDCIQRVIWDDARVSWWFRRNVVFLIFRAAPFSQTAPGALDLHHPAFAASLLGRAAQPGLRTVPESHSDGAGGGRRKRFEANWYAAAEMEAAGSSSLSFWRRMDIRETMTMIGRFHPALDARRLGGIHARNIWYVLLRAIGCMWRFQGVRLLWALPAMACAFAPYWSCCFDRRQNTEVVLRRVAKN